MWRSTICCQFALGEVSLSQKPFTRATVRWETLLFASGQVKLYERACQHIYILLTEATSSDCELKPILRQHSKRCDESTQLMCWDQKKEGSSNGFVGKAWRMSKKKVLLTIIDPPGEFFTGSKESLARWWGSERVWGNSISALKFLFCSLNCQRWFTVYMYTYFIEGSWSPAPHQLSHLEYSSKAPKTTEAILSGVIWTENHLLILEVIWTKTCQLNLVFFQNSSLWCTCAPTWRWSRRERESQKGWIR